MLLTEGERFVAFFDILGFGSWVESVGSKEVFTYVRGFLNLMVRASLPGSIVHSDMSVNLKKSDIGYINFSDCIVFYSRNDSYKCLKTMLKVCGEFMNVVICGPSRMLRGAITHGEFYVDSKANAYVGKALIDAFHLEKNQNWLGLSLHESVEVVKDFPKALKEYKGYIVKSLVPLKNNPTKLPYCINWANEKYLGEGSFNAIKSIEDCYNRGRESLKGNFKELEKLKRRIKNKKDFLEYYNPEIEFKEIRKKKISEI
jgi:hypothetical protein